MKSSRLSSWRYFNPSVVLFSLVAILGAGCSPQASKPSTTATPSSQATDATPIRIAVIPWQSPEEQQKKLKPLADYLKQTTGRSFSFQVTKDYKSAVDLLATEKVEIAYLAALTYVKAKQKNPNVEPIVMPIDQNSGRPWYSAVIVADSTKGIKSLEGLKGKRFAFVSPSSTSGFLMPMSQFAKQGIDPTRDFALIKYSGSHDKAEADLASGKVDAIANDKPSFLRSQKAGKLGSRYKIIWESDPIPTGPIVVNTKKLPAELVASLKKALIDAPMGSVDVSGTQSSGYTLAKDDDFAAVRKLYARLGSKTVAAK